MSSEDYFARQGVVEAMRHDHLHLWQEMLAPIRRWLTPGCRILDLGCSSGELLRILCIGVPGVIESARPALALGLELTTMHHVVVRAAELTPAELPVLYSTAGLECFPGQFDVIVSHEMLYLVRELDRLLADAHAALRPGGVFCGATCGYLENPYFRRWRERFEARGIWVRQHPSADYEAALHRAGFVQVRTEPLVVPDESYTRWRAESPFDDVEWFESEEDERAYMTRVGKHIYLAEKGAPA